MSLSMTDLRRIGLVGAILSSALILSACNLYQSTPDKEATEQNLQQVKDQAEKVVGVIVKSTDSGFTPAQVTVKSGSNLTWVNGSSGNIQIATDPHPVHTGNKELSNGQFVLELEPGDSVTVKLEKTGSFGYHDHLNPGVKGKVVVQ